MSIRKARRGLQQDRHRIPGAGPELTDRFEALKAFCLALDDVQQKTLKYYFAFKRIKNFACVEVHPSSREITVFVRADYDDPGLLERID